MLEEVGDVEPTDEKMQQRQMLTNRCCESLAVFRNDNNLALDDGRSILLGPFMTPQQHAPSFGFTLGHAYFGGAPTHVVNSVNPNPIQSQAATLGMQLSDQVRYDLKFFSSWYIHSYSHTYECPRGSLTLISHSHT